MWTDDDVVMVSAIEHWSYCPRQCALIHVEQVFDENLYTLRGRMAHEKADDASWETTGDARLERALPLWSEKLGLLGRADAVEFRSDGSVYPVEYKHGKRRPHRHDALQLCAQVACLEEMLGREVPGGAVYYVASKRRRDIEFTAEMRALMEETIGQIRESMRTGRMPAPFNDERCENCSLADSCMPAVAETTRFQWHLRDLYRPEAEDEP